MPIAVSAGLALDLGARTGRPGCRRDALLVQQRDERVTVQALDQRQRMARRALGALADELDAGHLAISAAS